MRNGLVLIGLASVLLATPCLAQTTTGTTASGATPAPGTGTTTSSGPSSTRPTDLDLPLEKPILAAPTPTPAPPVPPPTPDDGDEDDPRDEPPPVIYGEEIESENDTIFYVIDRSGSMDWDEASYTDLDGSRRRGNRMERAKVELSRSIVGLARNFRFNIIGFDCSTVQWQRDMQDANDANKQAAIAWVRGLHPMGATGTGPAVALALSDRENMSVVLLTDGEPNCGVPHWIGNEFDMNTHRRMIRDENVQGATITVFGIAASGQYRRFCQNVAADSGGSYFDVP